MGTSLEEAAPEARRGGGGGGALRAVGAWLVLEAASCPAWLEAGG